MENTVDVVMRPTDVGTVTLEAGRVNYVGTFRTELEKIGKTPFGGERVMLRTQVEYEPDEKVKAGLKQRYPARATEIDTNILTVPFIQ